MLNTIILIAHINILSPLITALITEEMKRVGAAGVVALLKRVKTSAEKTSVLKFAVNSIHNGMYEQLWPFNQL
jgi:hypothetical protein